MIGLDLRTNRPTVIYGLLRGAPKFMKEDIIPVRFLGALLLLSIAIGVRAKSLPETNALRSEVKIAAPVDLLHGHFGSKVAAQSNLFVVGFRRAGDSAPDAPWAAIYSRTNSVIER